MLCSKITYREVIDIQALASHGDATWSLIHSAYPETLLSEPAPGQPSTRQGPAVRISQEDRQMSSASVLSLSNIY